MPPKKGILQGKKMSTNHSSYIPEAERVLITAKKHPAVKKVSIADIKQIRNGEPRMSAKPYPGGGIRVVVRGRNARQIIYIATSEVDEVTQHLLLDWKKRAK